MPNRRPQQTRWAAGRRSARRQRAGAHPRVLELEARTDSCSNQFDYGTHYHQTAEASEEARAAAAKTLEAAHAVSLKVVAETNATIESDGLERHHQGAHGKAGYDSLGYMPKLAVSEAERRIIVGQAL